MSNSELGLIYVFAAFIFLYYSPLYNFITISIVPDFSRRLVYKGVAPWNDEIEIKILHRYQIDTLEKRAYTNYLPF